MKWYLEKNIEFFYSWNKYRFNVVNWKLIASVLIDWQSQRFFRIVLHDICEEIGMFQSFRSGMCNNFVLELAFQWISPYNLLSCEKKRWPYAKKKIERKIERGGREKRV